MTVGVSQYTVLYTVKPPTRSTKPAIQLDLRAE